MELKSKKVVTKKSAEELFDYLSDLKNFESLMPENTSKFEVLDENSFVFALKGMPDIVLEIKESHRPDKIVLGSGSDKIPFSLTGDIESISEDSSSVQLFFEGKFNAMMAMMVKSPINKFIGTLADRLESLS